MNMSEYEKNFEKFVLDNNFDWMPIEQKQVKNFDDLSDIVQFLRDESEKCANYGTDIEYDIEALERLVVVNGRVKNSVWQYHFGFRENGVDGIAYISSVIESPEIYGEFKDRYFSAYKLEIINCGNDTEITTVLYKLEF